MNTLEDWTQAIVGYHKQIEAALPIVERYKMPLAIENHKDWRVDEQVALLERYSSEYLGVSLDTGNNLSILDDPMETVEKLAPSRHSCTVVKTSISASRQGGTHRLPSC